MSHHNAQLRPPGNYFNLSLGDYHTNELITLVPVKTSIKNYLGWLEVL